MPDPDAFHPNLRRGILLREQNRPKEAVPFIQAAIAANPDAPEGYAELANCLIKLPSECSKSIRAIDRAISLDPTNSYYFGRKGWFFVCLGQFHAARKAAEKGLTLNPTCIHSLNALANAYTKLKQWKKAEAICHRILALDPNDAPALNLLAQALRHMGRWKESRAVVHQLLALLPNNAFGQMNAGYGALAAGDHLRANEHFLESLRLDPHFDLARHGLLKSLRARIWIIRFNIYVGSFFTSIAQRPATFLNLSATVLVFIGSITLLAYASQFLNSFYPNAGTLVFGIPIIGVILYLYLSAIVGLLGNFLLLFDPLGRHALTGQEKAKACVPAVAYLFLIFYLVANAAWIFALILTASLTLLAFTIQFPLLKDRWLRRRLKPSDE